MGLFTADRIIQCETVPCYGSPPLRIMTVSFIFNTVGFKETVIMLTQTCIVMFFRFSARRSIMKITTLCVKGTSGLYKSAHSLVAL